MYLGYTIFAEVNQVSVVGADLQGDSLSHQFENEDFNAGGSFSLAGETLTYIPGGYTSGGPVADPEISFYDRYTFRISDGTNLSPFIDVRIISLNPDTVPVDSVDGVPDAWMSDNFGSASGSTASADPDGDGLTNIQEFLLGTDPNDANSRFQVVAFDENALEWSSQRFDNYRVESTDDLESPTWEFEALVTQDETDATFIYRDLPAFGASTKKFYRVKRLD